MSGIVVEELDWPAPSPDPHLIDTFGMSWNRECEPGLLIQYQCLTSHYYYYSPINAHLNLVHSLPT